MSDTPRIRHANERFEVALADIEEAAGDVAAERLGAELPEVGRLAGQVRRAAVEGRDLAGPMADLAERVGRARALADLVAGDLDAATRALRDLLALATWPAPAVQ